MNILFGICALIGILCAFYIIGYFWCVFKIKVLKKGKESELEKFDTISELFSNYPVRYILLGAAIILITIWSFDWFKEVVGYDNINYKPRGTYCYYVEIQNAKKYVLPAKISVSIEEYEDAEGHSYTSRKYYIEKAYWTNGGYLLFEGNDSDITINDTITLYDQNENQWEVELVNKSALCNDFNNTTAFSRPLNVTLEIAIAISEITVWVGGIIYKKNEKGIF